MSDSEDDFPDWSGVIKQNNADSSDSDVASDDAPIRDAASDSSTSDDEAINSSPDKAINPLSLMRERNAMMHSVLSVENGRAFRAKPTDVFVVTYPKCGTTWCTQICHQIRCVHARRTNDSIDPMAFGEITEVVPWDILALDCLQDLYSAQVCTPRVFKSHEAWTDIAKGAKYICVVRDPVDVFYSFYNFLPPYMGIEDGAITHAEFADAIFAGASHSGHVWQHFLGYFDAKYFDEDVTKTRSDSIMMLCFEDLKENLPECVRRIAAFMGFDDLTDTELDEVVRASGFEFMRANATKFDDHFVRSKMWKRCGIPESDWRGGGVGKVREGGGKIGGGGAGMSAAVRDRIDAKWTEIMGDRGFDTYSDFRNAVNRLAKMGESLGVSASEVDPRWAPKKKKACCVVM
jgi:aryl sulfotransferase